MFDKPTKRLLNFILLLEFEIKTQYTNKTFRQISQKGGVIHTNEKIYQINYTIIDDNVRFKMMQDK